jgi:hypothetical protein
LATKSISICFNQLAVCQTCNVQKYAYYRFDFGVVDEVRQEERVMRCLGFPVKGKGRATAGAAEGKV